MSDDRDILDRYGRADDETIAGLPARRRLSMAETLAAGSDPRRDGLLRRLYRAQPLDPGFLAIEKRRVAMVMRTLEARPDWQSLRDDWASLGAPDRQRFLEDVAALATGLAGLSPAPRVLIESGTPQTLTGPNGFYRSDRQLIVIRETQAGTDTDFPRALALVLHETSHHLQTLWCADRSIAKGHPLHTQISWFAANMREGGYVRPYTGGLADYKAQPVERHAFQVEQWVYRMLGPVGKLEADWERLGLANDNRGPERRPQR